MMKNQQRAVIIVFVAIAVIGLFLLSRKSSNSPKPKGSPNTAVTKNNNKETVENIVYSNTKAYRAGCVTGPGVPYICEFSPKKKSDGLAVRSFTSMVENADLDLINSIIDQNIAVLSKDQKKILLEWACKLDNSEYILWSENETLKKLSEEYTLFRSLFNAYESTYLSKLTDKEKEFIEIFRTILQNEADKN